MYLKKNLLPIGIITFLILLGLAFILLGANLIITIIIYGIAALMIMIAINFLITSRGYVGADKNNLIIQSIVLIVISLLTFIFKDIMIIVIGVVLILHSLWKLVLAENRVRQFLHDIYKYIIALLLLLQDPVLNIALKILGFVLIVLAIYLIILMIKNRNNDKDIIQDFLLKYFIKRL